MEKNVQKIVWYSFLTLIMVVIIGVIVFTKGDVKQSETNLSSVTVGNEYNATTTSSNSGGFVNYTSPFHIKKAPAVLGSVIVTSAGTAGGRVNFYNATTSNINLRAAQYATTSITTLSLPTDLAVGTYTFDTSFPLGLIMDWTGTIGTTTVTYR